MDSSDVEVCVQVLEASDLPSGGGGSDVLVVTAHVAGEPRETLAAAIKSVSGRAVWSSGNVLAWRVSAPLLAQLRETAPAVRLNVVSRPRAAAPGSQGTVLGYVLLPLKVARMSLERHHPPWCDWLPLLGTALRERLTSTAAVSPGARGGSCRGALALPAAPAALRSAETLR